MANAGKLFWLAAFTFISRMSLAAAADFAPNYQNAELRGSDGAIFARVGIDLKPQHIQEAGGRKFLVHDDGLEVLSSEPDEAANDALCRVAWYREYSMRIPNCWFSAEPPQDVAAFDANHLYRPAAAYIEKRDKAIYSFVINVVNLETGIDHDLTLAIPYVGDFPMPEHGYFAEPGYTHAGQPHLLVIGDLSVEDNTLRVVMKRPEAKSDDAVLAFRLPGT